MSFEAIKKIFTRRKKEEPKENLAENEPEEDSPATALWKRHAENSGAYATEQMFSDGFENETEKRAAMDAIFQRPPISWDKPADPSSIFLVPSEANTGKRMATAMDDAPTGRGLKGANPYSSAANAKAVHLGNTSNGPISGAGFDPLKKYGINEKVLKHYQNRCFITWNSCAIIAGHELVAPACSIPAEDAMAHGYHVVCNSRVHEHGGKHEASEVDFLKQVKIEADKMNISDLAVKLVTKKHIFGVIMAIPVMVVTDENGNEIEGERFDYSQEYDPAKITKNSYKGFAIVEPQWLTYEFDAESSMDPTSLHFYEPTYIVKPDGTKIHRSWVIRLINKEVCDILKPTYYFGGLSLTQMLYERMWCADKIANEAPLLAMTKRLLIADGNMEQLISEPKKANLFFKAINYFRDNWSVFVKKPSAQVQQLDTSLSDLTPVTMSQYQLVAAIAQIPVTKLMKNVPSGLQSTGQYEWDDYAQKLIGIQQKDIKPFLDRHYELYCRSRYWIDGRQRTDLSLTVEFEPIDMPKSSEKTQQASQQVQAAASMLGNGLATIAEARAFLRKTGNTFFDAIGTELPELLKKMEDAKDPEKQQQMQMMQQGGMGGGMPGMGGGQPQPEQPSPEDMANQQNDNVFQDALASITGGGPSSGGAEEGGSEGGIFQNALSEINSVSSNQNGQENSSENVEGQSPQEEDDTPPSEQND